MRTINSIIAIFYRDLKITYRNYYDLFSIFVFFLLGIFIFIFATSPSEENINQISVGLMWALLVLSTNLSIKRFYQEDFFDGNLFLFHASGLSFELIVMIKIFVFWLLFQLPFIVFLPVGLLILNFNINNLYLISFTFLISSPILTLLASISGSINLINKRNFAMGSIIVMILSIPVIIFSVGVINEPIELAIPQLSILAGILFFFLSVTPWISAACIRIALKNK